MWRHTLGHIATFYGEQIVMASWWLMQ